ncbi:MAG: carboxymuconolactone decarboxylase family protein [Bacteroidota bacterium]
MRPFDVPTREDVSERNRQIFDDLEEKVGFVPNIYATYAHSSTAPARYLTFSNSESSLNNREKEAINLVTSQVNGCAYCLAAHTKIGGMNGFTEEQTLEIRQGQALFDPKLHAVVSLAQTVALNRGKLSDSDLEAFFDAGHDKEKLVDVIVQVGEKSITNLLHNVTQIPVDFPEAPELDSATTETVAEESHA